MGTFNSLHLVRQVDLFTLQLFLSAVEEGQIGRAAIRENISASTATKRIQDLETIAGVELLERGPTGVVPSKAGEIFARHARSIFESIEGLRSEISAFSENMNGKVVIASVQSIIMPFLASALGNFCRDFPMVEISLIETDNSKVPGLVRRGDAEIGILAMNHGLDLDGLDVVAYRRDRLVVVVPRTHELSRDKKIMFADLPKGELIALEALTRTFDATVKRPADSFTPHFTVRSAGVALGLVQAGLGFTILPDCLISRDMDDWLRTIELAEPWARRSLYIVTAAGRSLGPASAALVRQLLDRPRDDVEADPPG